MTAELLEYTSESDAVVRRVQAARSASYATIASRRPAAVRAEERWSGRGVHSCEVSRPALSAGDARPTTRLEWTARGIAVMVVLVALVIGVMLATLVGAFLSVSDQPLEGVPASSAVVLAASRPGR